MGGRKLIIKIHLDIEKKMQTIQNLQKGTNELYRENNSLYNLNIKIKLSWHLDPTLSKARPVDTGVAPSP